MATLALGAAEVSGLRTNDAPSTESFLRVAGSAPTGAPAPVQLLPDSGARAAAGAGPGGGTAACSGGRLQHGPPGPHALPRPGDLRGRLRPDLLEGASQLRAWGTSSCFVGVTAS